MNGSTDLFRTRDHVAHFERYVEDFASCSAASRQKHHSILDVSYGTEPSEKLDLFLPPVTGRLTPVHLFIHGGYWRMFSKDDFSFVADTIVASGAIAAVMDYALMPTVRMKTIVNQVRQAAKWLAGNVQGFGGDPNQLSVSGHSAGAHLCCTLLEADAPVVPKSALLLSGIYELQPLQSSFLQPLIGLTEEEVAKCSPITKRYRSGTEVLLAVGEKETAPFHLQADAMQASLAAQDLRGQRIDIRDGNHMSVALDLGVAATEAGQLLSRTVQRSRTADEAHR